MNINEAVNEALKQPTLIKALSYICTWENERAVKQAIENPGSGANGAQWDTCFEICISRVMEAYATSKSVQRLLHQQ